MQVCPSCGFENADSAKFCSQCGTALAAVPTQRREERKVVTVVFADLVGSTARAEQLDPEDVRAILAPYHDRLRSELERHGGMVEKFIGDAVVGVFGAPVAHEDDPERAVRSALAIQEAITELNEADPQLELEVRIGVHTGEALVAIGARPELGEAMVAGDVMNTGARLQSAAPPGGILAGDSTYRVTSRAIEYSEFGPVEAKGKAEPLAAWLALARRSRFGVDVVQKSRAPLVGRQREVELLAAALARAREEKEPQLVTIVGVPGIGKSRLVFELLQIVDEDPELIVWRQGRSLSYGEGVAFWALGEIVKAQAGILESDGAAEAAEKLSAAVRDLVEESEAEWVERHLRPLIGLAGDTGPGSEERADGFAAWRRFFEWLATRGPVVIVFEDLQWADDGLLDFVDELPDRVVGVPLLVVCSARPELLERRPGWSGGKRNALSVSLQPLSDQDTARLISALLDRSVLAADDQVALLQRAGGNPLYAEEYARMLAEGDAGAIEVPETLQGIVVARIDGLPDDEKELLQQASVLGKVFWTDALAALTGANQRAVDDRLYLLERKEFVRREQRSAVAGARQYVFVHALVRDGAYGQMPRLVRAESHRRVAEWIDQRSPDRAEDRSEMLAHHLVAAVEYGRAAGTDVAQLLPRAARALRDAGDRAWGLGALHHALELYERSRALDPASEDDPHLLLRLGRALFIVRAEGEAELEHAAAALAGIDSTAAAEAEIALGELIWQRGDQEGGFSHFDRAGSLVDDLPSSRQKGWVLSQLARFRGLAGHERESLELAERSIALANELGDRELLADSLNTRGMVRAGMGEPGWLEDLESSLSIGLELNSFRVQRAYLNLGSSLASNAGDLSRAEALYVEGLRHAQTRGSPVIERWHDGNLAECEFHLGQWDEAARLVEAELAYSEPHYLRHVCRHLRAYMRLARGDREGAIADSETAIQEARAIRDPQALVPGLSLRALLLARVGEIAGAEETLAELAEARTHTEPPGMWATDLAFALLELGREAEYLLQLPRLDTPWRVAAIAIANGDLAAAADTLAAIGAGTSEAYARLTAAERLSAAGMRADAEDQLAGALGFYRRVGATAFVQEGEALIAAAS